MDATAKTRRRILGCVGAALTAAVAGCETLSDDESTTPTEPEYDHLKANSVYVADGVDVTVPERIPTVDDTTEADLLLIPADTTVDVAEAIQWLATGRVVALLGDGAQETWLDWIQSEAYEDAFGRRGYAESDPAPDLLVLVPGETGVTGHNYTWASGYDDRDVLEGVEDALGHE